MLEKTNTSVNLSKETDEQINLRSTKIGVLLIHGLTGMPLEMRPIAKHLKKLGYLVEVPLIAGHGSGHEELLATTWQDWLDSMRKSVNNLAVECDQVIIVGLSVGGLLGVLLAGENPKVSGLVLLSFALGIPGPNTPKSRILLPLVFKFPILRKYLFWTEMPPYGLKDKRLQQNITRTIEASKRCETSRYGLFRTYVDTLYQHKLLEKEVCQKASLVKCSTLIMHSLEDTMLSTENATKIYNLLGSKEKSLLFITGCDHVMTVDLRKDEVARQVGMFISNITENTTNQIKSKETKDNNLSCEVYPRLNSVSNSEWTKLFPGFPDSLEMINLIQRSGFDGFNFHSIIVKQEDKPILFLPLFETNYNISRMMDKEPRKIFNTLAGWMPNLLCPKVLGVGFVEGEWGQIGYDSSINKKTMEEAWDMALEALDSLALGLNADIISFVSFNAESGEIIPIKKLEEFTNVPGLPCARLPIKFNTLEDYINSLSSSMRKDIRRKIRESSDVKIIRTSNIKPYLETIYQFYLKLVERSNLVFGIHRPSFFDHVCELVPGAEYVLYFADEKLIGFKLNVVKPDCMIDKYFGMDPVFGRKYNLYFISWIENIRYCIENKIPLYNAGQAEEDVKSRLGTQLLPSVILFKHKNPYIQWLLNKLKKQLSYEFKTNLPQVELGTYWKE